MITNPVTIIAFVGIFTGLGVSVSEDYSDAAVLVGGVFLGSALWWLAPECRCEPLPFTVHALSHASSEPTGGC